MHTKCDFALKQKNKKRDFVEAVVFKRKIYSKLLEYSCWINCVDMFYKDERVLNAAKAEFLEKGFEKASIRSIGEKEGMTSAGLYRHCIDKEEHVIIRPNKKLKSEKLFKFAAG